MQVLKLSFLPYVLLLKRKIDIGQQIQNKMLTKEYKTNEKTLANRENILLFTFAFST
jgi:hypothetical protein